MPSYAHVAMVGNLGQDPELRYTINGSPVMSFAMAVNRRTPVSNARDEWKEEVSWIDVTAFGRLAENLHGRIVKGTLVCVDGYLHQDRWENKEGQKRSKLIVRANTIVVGAPNPPAEEQGDEPPDIPF